MVYRRLQGLQEQVKRLQVRRNERNESMTARWTQERCNGVMRDMQADIKDFSGDGQMGPNGNKENMENRKTI